MGSQRPRRRRVMCCTKAQGLLLCLAPAGPRCILSRNVTGTVVLDPPHTENHLPPFNKRVLGDSNTLLESEVFWMSGMASVS